MSRFHNSEFTFDNYDLCLTILRKKKKQKCEKNLQLQEKEIKNCN